MKITKVVKSFLLAMCIFILAANPALAVANPTSVSIITTNVFENIFETGDMLFVVEYDIVYATEPTEPADTTFMTELLSENGTTIYTSRPVEYYQRNVTSIYVSASQVTSLGLVWGSLYKIRVAGNPAIFSSLVEGTNMATRTYALSNWNEDGTLTSKQLLQVYCIDIASDLENEWVITLITTTSSGTQILNAVGTSTFLTAIPSLSSELPELFYISSSQIVVAETTSNATFAKNANMNSRIGASLETSFAGIGTFLGIGTQGASGIYGVVVILAIASIVFLASGNTGGALLFAVLPFGMVSYLGIIPMQIIFISTIALVVWAIYRLS